MATFVVSWCEEGLEGIIPITQLEQEEMWAVLKNSKVADSRRTSKAVWMMIMRAKFNPQRHYEVYAIEAVDGIELEDLRRLFDEAPQQAADLLRERGQMLFSDRRHQNTKIVIS